MSKKELDGISYYRSVLRSNSLRFDHYGLLRCSSEGVLASEHILVSVVPCVLCLDRVSLVCSMRAFSVDQGWGLHGLNESKGPPTLWTNDNAAK